MFKQVSNLSVITFKGGVRTKVFITLIILSVIAFVVVLPSFASFSMRQIREVATSLSLSLISFVLLVLTLFLGVHLIYKDIENRITHFTLSQPISRDAYILGKFVGLSIIIILSSILLAAFSSLTLLIADRLYSADMPIQWSNYLVAILMELIKTLVIGAFVILFSSFSTNMFLPLFGTIGIYIVGNVSQSIYDYIQGAYGEKLPYITVLVSKFAYYIFPNFTLYDYKFSAIYNLPISYEQTLVAILYALLYIAITLSLSIIIFRKREML
jgi:ABC-type transport system involved in multi-copper enzyme maturation permease subunit